MICKAMKTTEIPAWEVYVGVHTLEAFPTADDLLARAMWLWTHVERGTLNLQNTFMKQFYIETMQRIDATIVPLGSIGAEGG
jgi:hypothetical protein